jgi:hypothetical protein
VAAIVEPGRVALDIPEILESVLSFLPPRTLFGVQRVSHLWKSTIAASPPIQEKMFLRLRTKTSEIWMLTNPRSVPRGWNRGEERPGLDWNFRIVGDTEMQSGSWKIKSGELQRLLTASSLPGHLLVTCKCGDATCLCNYKQSYQSSDATISTPPTQTTPSVDLAR